MLTLAHLTNLLLDLFRLRRNGDERFLADATDLCDLERRMRAIDERDRTQVHGSVPGL